MNLFDTFTNIEIEAARLRRAFAAGELSADQYKNLLNDLMLQDAKGNWWMIGAETGKWYRYDGQEWVQAIPSESVTSETKTSRKSARKFSKSLIAMMLIGIIVVSITLVWFFFNETKDSCSTVDECLDQARIFAAQDDPAKAVEMYASALEIVPTLSVPEEFPSEHWYYVYHFLWCEKGAANLERGQVDLAISDYGKCIEWVNKNDPNLAEAHLQTRETLRSLLERSATACSTSVECEVSYFRETYLTDPYISGQDVLSVQQRLVDLEYYQASVDGIFGPATEEAVKSFQTDSGLQGDGIVEPITWSHLFQLME